MKRGERKLWRELATLSQKMADSSDYAQEYIARNEATKTFQKLTDILNGKK